MTLSRGSGRALRKDGEGGDPGDEKESAPWSLRGRRHSGRRNRMCKGPGVGVSLGLCK